MAPLEAATPILVPSFSSRGFPEVGELHAALGPMLTTAALVSAFDIHHGLIDGASIYTSDILFVDSGCYEASAPAELHDPYPVPPSTLDWTPELHAGVLGSLEEFSPIAAVTFDHYGPFSEQLARANMMADELDGRFVAVDFLLKPERRGDYLDAPTPEAIATLAKPGLLGVTEKEVGTSLHNRCVTIARLRLALDKAGLPTPIHVFGALDPATVLCYFLCGADVFDGLTWLRFTLERNVPVYHAHGTVLLGEAEQADGASMPARALRNAAGLASFQRALSEYAESGNPAPLTLHLEVADRARDIAATAIQEARR